MSYLKLDKIPGRQRNRPLKDYTGQRFGRLVAVKLVERDPRWNGHRWLFRCDCGNEATVSIKLASSGNTSSCGCLFSEMLAARNTTHGLMRSNSGEYRSWKDMRARCNNPNNTDYRDYGGRGIVVCKRWDDFAAFLSDMGPRPEGHTLDRINVNDDYHPGNCRWAEAKTQANNKRSNRLLTIDGVTRTLQEWSEFHGLERTKVKWRLAQGWPLDKVFSKDDHRKPQP